MTASFHPTEALPAAVDPRLNGVARITTLGVIRIEGEEAARFIHGQLSNDFSLLGLNQARLSAYCNPQGRMLASFIGFKVSPQEILLLCHSDLLEATLKRLSMFVMRAKARLSNATTAYQIWGLAGAAQCSLGEASAPDTKPQPWDMQRVSDAGPYVITLYPAAGVHRQLWIAPGDHPQPSGAELTEAMWNWSEIQSGVATLSSVSAQAYVPQMLNYESIGGVNFKKGCYPGQEVVARSQFRGTLKRRTYILHSDTPLHAGDAVFAGADTEQPVGGIVQVAKAPDGGVDALASLQISAIGSGNLRTAAATALSVCPLPYALLEDI